MLAELITGERDWSDVLLLAAVVLFLVAAATSYKPTWPFAPLVAYVGAAALAAGLLLL